ncbi:hypothetical protein D3C71_1479190 [compost metagenome]
MSNSGVVSRIAGDAIGADSFLPNMGSEDFLLCLSRQALEAAAKEANVLPRQKVRETRSALIEHFKDGHFVHASALFAPDVGEIADLMKHADYLDSEEGAASADDDSIDGEAIEDGAPDEVPADEADGLDSFERDVPFEENDASEAAPDDEQDAYGIAAE